MWELILSFYLGIGIGIFSMCLFISSGKADDEMKCAICKFYWEHKKGG